MITTTRRPLLLLFALLLHSLSLSSSLTTAAATSTTTAAATTTHARVRAAFFMLLHNKTVESATFTFRSVCCAFNNATRYPVVVFHEPISDAQKQSLVDAFCGDVLFHIVDFSSYPGHPPLDPEVAKDFEEYPRLTSLGYRHMCRFMSGPVFMHPAFDNFDYTWRLDSDATYLNPIPVDAFHMMQTQGLQYMWMIYFCETYLTPGKTLWPTSREFFKKYTDGDNDIPNVFPGDGSFWSLRMTPLRSIWSTYNCNHFWNNAEILDLRFFRSKPYQDYFNYLDAAEGFYRYRWGDAIVRTIGVQMFMPAHKVRRFHEADYHHQTICSLNHPDVPYACNFTEIDCGTVYPDGRDPLTYPLQAFFRGVEKHHIVYLILSLLLYLVYCYRISLTPIARNLLRNTRWAHTLRADGGLKDV